MNNFIKEIMSVEKCTTQNYKQIMTQMDAMNASDKNVHLLWEFINFPEMT